MKTPWRQKLRDFVANPIPRRRASTIATWWEWRGRTYKQRSLR